VVALEPPLTPWKGDDNDDDPGDPAESLPLPPRLCCLITSACLGSRVAAAFLAEATIEPIRVDVAVGAVPVEVAAPKVDVEVVSFGRLWLLLLFCIWLGCWGSILATFFFVCVRVGCVVRSIATTRYVINKMVDTGEWASTRGVCSDQGDDGNDERGRGGGNG